MNPDSAAFDQAVALAERGRAAQEAGDPSGALALYDRALPALDGFAALHRNRALCLRALGWDRLAEAADAYRRVCALSPDEAAPFFELGTTLLETSDFPGAAVALARAVALDPSFAPAWQNLALARSEQGDLPGARAALDAAVARAPDDAALHCNRALNLLLTGEWEAGWSEYEWRWRLPETTYHAPLWPMPAWNGEPLEGKRLLLWTEQGAGTAIQFIRYAAPLAARGAEVAVACDPPLRRLLAAARGVARAVPRDPFSPEGDADFHLPLVSAARLLGTRPDDVPLPAAFALPSAPPRQGKPAVALVWAGNPSHPDDARRSLSLRILAPLAEALGDRVRWLSFQQEPADFSGWPSGVPLERRAPFADFHETARALQEADFVVSADTAALHLAGSLGRPTALLLPFLPDWRWLTGRADTPWYLSVRLFRQTAPGRWEEPVAALAAHLAGLFLQAP